MSRIVDETTISTLADADYILLDNSSSGSHKISGADLKTQVVGYFTDPGSPNAAGFHNSIYRGKNLGSGFTDAQRTQITNGTFNDLFVGDYITVNSRVYRIADFDPFYRCGDTQLSTHHIALIPDTSMGNKQMHNTSSGAYDSSDNTTTGGYVSSDMRTTNLPSIQSTIISDLGDSHVLSYRDLLPTATNSNGDSSWAWMDCRVELMSETMVYGCKVWANSGYAVGCCCRQLSLFRLNPAMIHTRYTYWLRNASSAAYFCYVSNAGYVGNTSASNVCAVRPLVLYA